MPGSVLGTEDSVEPKPDMTLDFTEEGEGGEEGGGREEKGRREGGGGDRLKQNHPINKWIL